MIISNALIALKVIPLVVMSAVIGTDNDAVETGIDAIKTVTTDTKSINIDVTDQDTKTKYTNPVRVQQSDERHSKKSDSLVIATEGYYPPFNFIDVDGNLDGFDIDLSHALCRQMHVECTIITQDWDNLIPGLKQNKYDAIVAGMYVTPDREEVVDFTQPYFSHKLAWVTKKDSIIDATVDDSSRVINYKIGVQRAAMASLHIADSLGYGSHPNIRYFDTASNTFVSLEINDVDLVLLDYLDALYFQSEHPNYRIVGRKIGIDSHMAVAVQKDSPLKQKFDLALNNIKENGTLAKLEKQHFGVVMTKTN